MDKFICVGKNYTEHAKELGDLVPETPVLFFKPPSVMKVVPQNGATIEVTLPRGQGAVHHEVEILLKLDSNGMITDVSLGIDMTLRDLQAKLKKQGHPWEISKVFSNSAIVGPWQTISDFPHYLEEEFTFSLDGQIRQKGHGRNMRFSSEQCIDFAKNHFPICDGDIVFTGTPSGVGPVLPGQTAEVCWGKHLKYSIHFI